MVKLEALIANSQKEHSSGVYMRCMDSSNNYARVFVCALGNICLPSPLISAHNEVRSFYVQPVKSLATETQGTMGI